MRDRQTKLRYGTGKADAATASPEGLLAESVRYEKYFTFSVMALLFGFGIYQSVLYYGFQAMPAPFRKPN